MGERITIAGKFEHVDGFSTLHRSNPGGDDSKVISGIIRGTKGHKVWGTIGSTVVAKPRFGEKGEMPRQPKRAVVARREMHD